MPETVEEKQGQPLPAPPPPSVARSPLFPKFARLWIGVMAFCWAATLYHIPSHTGLLWDPPVATVSSVPIRWALPIAAVFGAAIIYFLLKKFGRRLDYYKPGQGNAVRLSVYGALAALTMYGAFTFYMKVPPISSSWWANIWALEVFGVTLSVKPVLFPAGGIFTTVMFVAFLMLNQERWSDFLLETEGELKKVSWPARKDYVGSSLIVVLVVVIISTFLHFVDEGLSKLMQWMRIGF